MGTISNGRRALPYEIDDPSQPTPPKGATKLGLLKALGPGLITGASDDDPSGIATYSQIGAQFGYGMLWTMVASYPLMAGIQQISAQIGRVTGRGIAGNLRRHYPRWMLYGIVMLVFVANTINIGADIGAMGAAAKLLIGGSAALYSALFALASVTLQILAPYDRYARVLKWLTAALLSYVVTVFLAHASPMATLRGTFIPTFAFNATFITAVVAVLGTTISPYLFFWQAGEEVEIEKSRPLELPLVRDPRQAPSQLHRIQVDTYAGMAVSNLIAYFIILTAAAALWSHGMRDIETSTQAAEALRPCGRFAYLLFTVGIIGTGLLAVPVLAGSAAYAVGEALHWPVGLARDAKHARGFYTVLVLAMTIGLGLNMVHIDPIKALFWSAVINGIAAGPIMVFMMLLACNPKVMGQFTLTRYQKGIGWAATVVMLLAALGLFATWGKS